MCLPSLSTTTCGASSPKSSFTKSLSSSSSAPASGRVGIGGLPDKELQAEASAHRRRSARAHCKRHCMAFERRARPTSRRSGRSRCSAGIWACCRCMTGLQQHGRSRADAASALAWHRSAEEGRSHTFELVLGWPALLFFVDVSSATPSSSSSSSTTSSGHATRWIQATAIDTPWLNAVVFVVRRGRMRLYRDRTWGRTV